MSYGLLITKFGGNLGDDIQSLAAMRYLPKIDFYIHRDKISQAVVAPHTRVIMNGWFMHNMRFWPPHQNIDPLFLSFHARIAKASNKMEWLSDRLFGPGAVGSCSDQKYAEYYQPHIPIGCRDQTTKEAFDAIGVPSYFSGCLTLTLPQSSKPRTDEIVFVDPFGPFPFTNYQPDLWYKIPKAIRRNATRLTHLNCSSNLEKRFTIARNNLSIYQTASLVITSRLHVALPCIAFGTDVILISTNHRDYRLKGYEKLLQAHSIDDFLIASRNGRFKELISNADQGILQNLKNKLEESCQKFISQ